MIIITKQPIEGECANATKLESTLDIAISFLVLPVFCKIFEIFVCWGERETIVFDKANLSQGTRLSRERIIAGRLLTSNRG